MAPYLIIIFIIIIIMLAVYGWWMEQQRREALRAWCRSHGWKMSGHSIDGWDVDYSGIRLFNRGHSRNGDNVITGFHRDHPITLLDYKYTTGSGKNRKNHHHGVTILDCGFPTIPLLIRREHAFDKVGSFLGMGDIDFESAEFSRKFFVKSSDRKWAYDVIHTRTMDYLLGAPKFSIEFGYGEIAIHQTGKCSPAQYDQQVEMAFQLYQLIPEYLIKQMKGE